MVKNINIQVDNLNKIFNKIINENILELYPKPLMLLVVDTETAVTGEIIQIAYNIYEYYKKTNYYKCIGKYDSLINEKISKVDFYRKFTLRDIRNKGKDPVDVFNLFSDHISKCDYIIGHNISFDTGKIIKYLKKYSIPYTMPIQLCTMKISRDRVGLLNIRGWAKYPKLSELYKYYYNEDPDITKTHTADYDIYLTFKCFTALCLDNLIKL